MKECIKASTIIRADLEAQKFEGLMVLVCHDPRFKNEGSLVRRLHSNFYLRKSSGVSYKNVKERHKDARKKKVHKDAKGGRAQI